MASFGTAFMPWAKEMEFNAAVDSFSKQSSTTGTNIAM